MFERDFDSFDDIQCEDMYDENYVMDNDYNDDNEDIVTYDDLTDFGMLEFEEF